MRFFKRIRYRMTSTEELEQIMEIQLAHEELTVEQVDYYRTFLRMSSTQKEYRDHLFIIIDAARDMVRQKIGEKVL